MQDIFEGATLVAVTVEAGLYKTVQFLTNGKLCVGSFFVSKTGEPKPRGGTLMSPETFQALAAQVKSGKGKAVEFPEVETVAKTKAPTKAELIDMLTRQNAMLAELQAKVAS